MSWIKKPTWRLIFVYSLLTFLILAADRPTTLSLSLGLPMIIFGELTRLWACGHLVKTKRLTTTGPYAYVKNPLYLGTILISAGFCLLAQAWIVLAIVAAGFFIYYMPRKKNIEGDRLRQIYGEAYERYEKAVPDLMPRFTAYRSGDTTKFNGGLVFENSEHGTAMSVTLGIALIYISIWLREQEFISIPWDSII